MEFRLEDKPIVPEELKAALRSGDCGACVVFEGWVRNENEGRPVSGLEYEAYPAVAKGEGQRILQEAAERFGVVRALCVHRVGALTVGDCAVWVGASTPHRGEAFDACRYIIDEVKHRVPIWKKEHYLDGDSAWVNCARCAAAGHRHGEAAATPTGKGAAG